MYHPILLLHSFTRFVILFALLYVLIKAVKGMITKTDYSPSDLRMHGILTITTHVQMVLGIVLYFISPFVVFAASTMKDSLLRYWTVEHISMMLVGVVLITIANFKLKRAGNGSKNHKTVLIYTGIALAIFVVSIITSKRGLFGITT